MHLSASHAAISKKEINTECLKPSKSKKYKERDEEKENLVHRW
jgi:hypothetical protein